MILRLPILLFSIALLGASSSSAQTPTPAGPGLPLRSAQVEKFETSEELHYDGEIDGLLKILEMYSSRAVLRPSSLPATTYALHVTRKIPADEAVQIIQTILSLNGISIVPMGQHYFKVVPLPQSRTEAPEMISGSTLSMMPSGRIAAKLFQPEYLRIEDFTERAALLVTPGVGGAIVPFPKANAALVTDTITNLQRIESLLQKLDRAAPLPKFYTLKFAKASEMVQKLQGILQNPILISQLGATPTYSADDRTNQVVIITDEKQLGFFDELIARLDVKADPNTRTDVLYLKHAEAKTVAPLLFQLISGQNNAASRAGSAQQFRTITSTPNLAGQPGQTVSPITIQSTSRGIDGASASTTFSSLITLIADERTNAIVVSGTLDDIRLLRELVDKMDIVLPQVRIEVVIAEVTLSDNQASGIDALGLQVDANRLVGITGSVSGATLSGSLDATGAASSHATINRPDTGGYTLSGLLNLKSTPTKSNANILSNPTIVTTHNKKATIKVGEQRPTITSYQNENTGASTVAAGYRSNVSYRDIGITLIVTPLIGDDGTVQLDIDQEVSDVLGEITIDGNPQPKIGNRHTTSWVTVKSGEIIVLGGLQRTSDSSSRSRLGPIPVIGDLLGSRSKRKDRTDLVFFLRHVVLTNTPADNEIFIKRLDQNVNKDAIKRALDPSLPEPQAEKSKGPSVRKK